MLDTFRENARSWLIQFIIGALSLVFILEFGPGSRGCRSASDTTPTWSAKVNGKIVPVMAFENAYRRQADMFQRYGAKPEDMARYKVRENVMKELVDDELLAQEAEKNGVYVGDDELGREIQKAFTYEGKFDADYYRNYLRRDRSFEDRMRRSLMAEHMRALAQNSVTVSEEDIKAQFLKEEEGASINYVVFRPSQFANKVQVTDDDINKTLTDKKADIQKKYEMNPSAYMQPRQRQAQRLFVPVKQNATPEEEAAAKKKIDDALAQLTAGKSFDDVAAQFKDDAHPVALGWISQGQSTLDRTTEDNIFKLQIGGRSEVIRAPLGFEILKVTEEKPPVQKKLEDVQKDIAREMAREAKLKETASVEANKTLELLKAGKPLAEQWPAAAKPEDSKKPALPSANPEAKTTEEFHPNGGIIQNLGSVPKVSAAAFALTADQPIPKTVIEDQGGYWVISLNSRARADLSKLTPEKKDEIREQVQKDKRTEMVDAWLETIRKAAAAKIEENPILLSYEHVATSSAPDDGS